ncbi:hypothetical protein BN2497_739 [Janthinobacterium sp. CG23_2]|nr:hypothetical protein BN2497_739 [Janthinobacterium sp. CG23_2]CUU26767.1 hypothetical protein BN3177_739 [Janthinobacterium sp. CG23_2]
MGSLDQQIALKLSYRIQHAHGHLSGSAGQIDPAERQAVHTNSIGRQLLYCGAHIHGIAAKSVQLGYDEYIAGFQTVKQPSKLRPFSGRDAAADAFAHDTAFVDREAGRLDFKNLVVCVLIGGADASVDEGTRHVRQPKRTKWTYLL